MKEGLAGKIAKGFMDSKLTVLLMIVFMVIGVYSSFLIPREEEPQIDVPMADIFVGYPGASPKELEYSRGRVHLFYFHERTGNGYSTVPCRPGY